MIATVTLNPAVDKTLNASRIVLGAVNRMETVNNLPGGKGINVTKVLRKYNKDVITLGLLGGYQGQFIAESILKMGAVDKFTRVSGQTRTSINVISDDGYVTELLEPGPTILPNEMEAFVKTYKEEVDKCDIIALSGSAPIGVPTSIYADLINYANACGKKVLLDSSGDLLKKGIYARPYMVKPNLKELETLLGRKLQNMQEICDGAAQIVEWGVPNVMVSMGAKGILYAYEDEDAIGLCHAFADNIKPINTVGSGDSVVAALALSVTEGLDHTDTLKRCVAISAANTLSIENGVVDPNMVKEIEATLKVSNL